MLRYLVIAFGVIYLAVAVWLWLSNIGGPCLVAYLIVNGIVLAGAILLERRGYRPRPRAGMGRWEDTGERVVDPKTGKVTRVLYNPVTGERDYVEE